MNLKQKKHLLFELSELIKSSKSPLDEHFEDKRKLLGFEISWLKADLHSKLCEANGIQAEKAEVMLMQAFGRTECHLHTNGSTLFKTLGPDDGFPHPEGSGMLTAMYAPGEDTYDLDWVVFEPGELSLVVPYQIHAFVAKEGKVLTALGVVQPRIRYGHDYFDVVDFEFLSDRKVRAAPSARSMLI